MLEGVARARPATLEVRKAEEAYKAQQQAAETERRQKRERELAAESSRRASQTK